MPGEFADARVIVTGGAAGIGAAVCRAFVAQGARVFLGDINRETAISLKESLCQNRADAAEWALCDVSQEAEIKQFVRQAIDCLQHIDILVNCAGVVSHLQPEEISAEAWDRTLDINLRGAFLVCREIIPLMKRRGRGVIINFSSAAVRLGGVATGADYAASKGGVAVLTLHLARRLARDGIRVNAVSPGVINTAMVAAAGQQAIDRYIQLIPMGRLGQPEEVAEAVLFLASPRASYITGAVLEVTGGF